MSSATVREHGLALPQAARPLLLTLFVAAGVAVPLLVTPVLPSIDFYAHVARYYILANLGADPAWGENYAAAWRLLPNLGLDVLATGLMTVLPPLTVAKVVGALTLAAPFAGTLYLSYAVQSRFEPLASLLAGILVYNHILVWGFSNFLVGFGMALGGIGFWIRARHRPGLQLFVSALLGVLLLFVHGFAFALWGVLLGTVELVLAFEARDTRPLALVRRAVRLALLAVVPTGLFLRMRTAAAEGGITEAFANLAGHAARGNLWPRLFDEVVQRLDQFLRVADSSFPLIDRGLGAILWGTLFVAVVTGAVQMHRRLLPAIGLCTLSLGLMPPNLFGVGHVDDRIPVVLLALIAAAIGRPDAARPRHRGPVARPGWVLPVIACLFVVRTGLVTAGWYHEGRSYAAFLDALAVHRTGDLGASVAFDPSAFQRTERPVCEPLRFLMLLENGTAVSTFANPTQQPLRITGPLRAARETERTGADGQAARLSYYADAGYDSVVACYGERVERAPTGFEKLAASAPWVLYRTSAAAEGG